MKEQVTPNHADQVSFVKFEQEKFSFNEQVSFFRKQIQWQIQDFSDREVPSPE